MVTNNGDEGGLQNPYKKGRKYFSQLKGGTTSFKEVKTQELEVLAILMGGAKGFHPLKGGHAKFYPVLREMRKMFWTHDFLFL